MLASVSSRRLKRLYAVYPFWYFTSGLSVSKDRKSTRLNSSHLGNSYAVFCWKKNRQLDPQLDQHVAAQAPAPVPAGHALLAEARDRARLATLGELYAELVAGKRTVLDAAAEH